MVELLTSILCLYYRPFILSCTCFAFYNFSCFANKIKVSFNQFTCGIKSNKRPLSQSNHLDVAIQNQLIIQGIAYFLFCNDKSWAKQQDPASYFNETNVITRKTIIFVRHGESTWNDTFNKGTHRSAVKFVLGFIPGLVKAIIFEFYLTFLVGKLDSWFYDAPLSTLGLEQVEDLAKFLKQNPDNANSSLNEDEKKILRIMRADDNAPPSVIVSSSLRRSISTIIAAFQNRLRRTEESVLVLPSLQEISRNPDTLSLTPARTVVTPSWLDESYDLCDFGSMFSSQVDMKYHIGNKPIDTNGYRRMREFCHVIFSDMNEDNIIVGGHSIWFRSFFKQFLPNHSIHMSKNKKIVNCGAVSFELCKTMGDGMEQFLIEESTIRVIYGGFK